jgi:hypothetical protein
MPFERASCTFEMMAWVLYAKCALHLPLDRQRRDFALQGATISTAMITRWFAEGGDLLRVIVAQLRLVLLASDHIHMDGSGITVLDFGRKGQPAPRGHVTVFCRANLAVFHYAPTKEGRHTEQFLTHKLPDGSFLLWKGTITADAESAHDRLFGNGDRVESGCNAHGLRKFRDQADKAPLLADAALSFIGRFYDAEDTAFAAGLTGTALLAHRQAHAAPVAVEFHAWLALHIEDLLPSNPVRKAMQYYLNHWDALTRFLADPAVLAPALSADASVAATAIQPDRAALNWEGGVGLSVPIWGGGASRARIAAAAAGLDQEQAALDGLKIDLYTAVATAQARVRAARATLEAATEAASAARERLRLAEGRYEHGLGDAVELSDAQLDATRSELRAVQARFDLASARAALLAALGEG